MSDTTASGHLETEETLARLGGDRELLEELYAAFAEDAPKKMQTLAELVEAGDLPMVMKQAHSLKGSSAAIGATKSRDFAFELESLANKGAEAQVRECFVRLQAEMDGVLTLIRQQL